MKIIKQEVKTVYYIAISAEDIETAKEAYEDSPLKDIGGYSGAFDGTSQFFGHISAMDYLAELWNSKSQVPTLNFIVKEVLGFRGIENYGTYNKVAQRYELLVYKYGDEINR